MRFEVPQFIEIEDKIFGPFTWRQFVYIGGGGGLAVVLLFTAPFLAFVFVGVPLAILAAALAFYPINNRPFSVFLESMWLFYKKNRMYYWRKKDPTIYKESEEVSRYANANPVPSVPSEGGISSLSRKLELNALQPKE